MRIRLIPALLAIIILAAAACAPQEGAETSESVNRRLNNLETNLVRTEQQVNRVEGRLNRLIETQQETEAQQEIEVNTDQGNNDQTGGPAVKPAEQEAETSAAQAAEMPEHTPDLQEETPEHIPDLQEETPEPQPTQTPVELTQEPSDMPGRPVNPQDVTGAIQNLSPEKQECLPPEVRQGQVSLDPDSVVGTEHALALKQVADCLDDEEIVRVMIIPSIEEEFLLTSDEEDCLASGNSGGMIRTALETEGRYPDFTDAIFIAVAGAFINLQDCLGEERAREVGISDGDLDIVRCIVGDPQGAHDLVRAIVTGDQDKSAQLQEQAMGCALQFPPELLIEPPPCGTEGLEPDDPCRETG